MFKGEYTPFFYLPSLRVRKTEAEDTIRTSNERVQYDDSLSVLDHICLNLAYEGWCQGDPSRIAKMNVKWALKMLNYQKFKKDFEFENYKIRKSQEVLNR